MPFTTTRQATATADPQGSGADVLDRLDGAEKRPQVIDFAKAEVELNQASRLAREASNWLDWQCRMVSGVRRGAVFMLPKVPGGALERAAIWPEGENRSTYLRNVAATAISSGDGLSQKEVSGENEAAEVCDYVAYPLLRNGRVVGAVAMALAIRSESQHQAVLQLLQWGTVWLEEAVARSGEDGQLVATLTLDAVQQLTAEGPLPVLAHHLCNLLADTLNCSLVALGMARGMQSRVIAISHQVRFDHRARRVAQLEFAMEEAIDRQARVALPAKPGDDAAVAQANGQLLLDSGDGEVCTVPIMVGGKAVAALTLLRDKGRPFDAPTFEVLDAVAEAVGPVIRLKQRESQSPWGRLVHAVTRPARRLIGPGHPRLKFGVAAFVLAVLALNLVQTDHRVSARANIEGRMQQAVVAPFAGYLKDTQARAGDRVDEGQMLASLDERELLLEQERLSGERAKHRKEYQQALAERDRAEVTMTSARIEQVNAQLRLVEDQLERTQVLAPFGGLLVSGDWSRALGAPLERGQLLFEIVPDEDFRVMLQVDEHDVSGLSEGQRGSLRLAGMPDNAIEFEVTRIFPVAKAADGANHFRVEAALAEVPDGLRPGMQGVAKVTVGHDSLFNVWTSSLRRRLQLWFWSLGL